MNHASSQEKWLPCPAPAVADTIRWREPVWDKPNKPRGRPDKIGEQLITAQVVKVSDPTTLRVIDVTRLSLMAGAADVPGTIQKDDVIRRKMSSIKSGACEKLVQES